MEMIMMQWGLVPFWVKNHQEPSMHSINARAETLSEKPMFRNLLKTKCCLVPASGFYEWKKEGKKKIPFYIHLKEAPVFAFAGLYEVWHDISGEAHLTYTIITTEANDLAHKFITVCQCSSRERTKIDGVFLLILTEFYPIPTLHQCGIDRT